MRKSKTSKILVIQRTFIARPQLHFSGRNSDKQKVLASQQTPQTEYKFGLEKEDFLLCFPMEKSCTTKYYLTLNS